jgi:hypothetical protein
MGEFSGRHSDRRIFFGTERCTISGTSTVVPMLGGSTHKVRLSVTGGHTWVGLLPISEMAIVRRGLSSGRMAAQWST